MADFIKKKMNISFSAGFYAENLLLYAPQAKEEGILPLPIGESHKFAPVALGVRFLFLVFFFFLFRFFVLLSLFASFFVTMADTARMLPTWRLMSSRAKADTVSTTSTGGR